MSALWLVCYDIADHRRRAAVAAALEAVGQRVLESVFEVWLDGRQMVRLRAELALLIKAQEDSIRFYPLCLPCQGAVSWQGRGAAAALGDWFWL
jgi:CRISPR-associated protein Cas2